MVLYAVVVQTLAGAAVVAVVLALALLGVLTSAAGRARIRRALRGHERHPIGWALAGATVATAGSLYFSEVVGFEPCLFCWYQRIAMYPLVPVLGVGLLRSDPGVWRYALPLPLVGVLLSAYHVLLQRQPALELVQCGTGPPCSARYLNIFGFVTIPMMAGAAFLLVIALLLALRVLPDDRPPRPGAPPT